MRQIRNRIKTYRLTNHLCDLLARQAPRVGASEGQFVRTAIYELCREIEVNPDVEAELRQRFAV